MDIEDIKNELKKRLSEERYKHSVGTMKSAGELAQRYGEDEEEAKLAGLIHDMAKELYREEMDKCIEKYNIEIDEIEKYQMPLLHAKIGAAIAKDEFGVSEKVQNAIKYHTTGNIEMDKFAKIVFIADKIEENRDYENVEIVRKFATENLDKTMMYILNSNIQKSISRNRTIHPNTTELRNKLIIERIEKTKNQA